jgi:hypothetical protein
LLQLTGGSHVPDELHRCRAELPEHWVAVGVHEPWHDATPPSATHAEFAHATAVPQLPVLSQVCTP